MPRSDGSLTPSEVMQKHDKDFRRFYQAYPKHVAPTEAQRVFANLVESGADPVKLIEAARAYAQRCGDDLQFVPSPHSWLKQGHHEDADLFTDERAAEKTWLREQWRTANVRAVENRFHISMEKQYPPDELEKPEDIEFWYKNTCRAWITQIASERDACQNEIPTDPLTTTNSPSKPSLDPFSSTPRPLENSTA